MANKRVEAPNIDDEHGVPFQVFYGVSGNTHNVWRMANARKVIGYAPDDDSLVNVAQRIADPLLCAIEGHGSVPEIRGEQQHQAVRRLDHLHPRVSAIPSLPPRRGGTSCRRS